MSGDKENAFPRETPKFSRYWLRDFEAESPRPPGFASGCWKLDRSNSWGGHNETCHRTTLVGEPPSWVIWVAWCRLRGTLQIWDRCLSAAEGRGLPKSSNPLAVADHEGVHGGRIQLLSRWASANAWHHIYVRIAVHRRLPKTFARPAANAGRKCFGPPKDVSCLRSLPSAVDPDFFDSGRLDEGDLVASGETAFSLQSRGIRQVLDGRKSFHPGAAVRSTSLGSISAYRPVCQVEQGDSHPAGYGDRTWHPGLTGKGRSPAGPVFGNMPDSSSCGFVDV